MPRDDTVAAAFNVAEGINPASRLIPITRIAGVTTALAMPLTGLIRGQAVLVDLDGSTLEAMLVKSPVAVVAELSEETKSAGGGSRAGSAARLRRVLDDAREYGLHKLEWSRGQMHPLAAPAADLAALAPVLRGQLPLIIVANRRSDIATALAHRARVPAQADSRRRRRGLADGGRDRARARPGAGRAVG